jgi:hypothetical protein
MYGAAHSPESIILMIANRKGKALGNQNARKHADNAARNRAYYERHRVKIRARVKARRADPDFMAKEIAFKRDYHLRTRYGISPAEYDRRLAAQGYKCAICATTEPGTRKSKYFDVDHCHTTGKVRALLCRNCNVTVGVVEKKSALMELIRDYLEKHV